MKSQMPVPRTDDFADSGGIQRIPARWWQKPADGFPHLRRLTTRQLVLGIGWTLFLIMSFTRVTAQVFTEIRPFNPVRGISVPNGMGAPAYVDIDSDGDFDLFFGAFPGTIQYHRNDGTTTIPDFVEQTGGDNPFNGVDLGRFSAPDFVDIDGDGDFDAFIGEETNGIFFYRNTGSTTSPIFTPQTGSDDPLDAFTFGNFAKPTFADLDADGDADLFVGFEDGTFRYFKNTGTTTQPTFTEQTGTDHPFNGLDLGFLSVIHLTDLDADGDLDAILAKSFGEPTYYENTGDANSPDFVLQTGANNPLRGINVGTDVYPTTADVDGDGDADLTFGRDSASLAFLVNLGSSTLPAFQLDVGRSAAPTFADLDDDGDVDVLIGESDGFLNYYRNDGSAAVPDFVEQFGAANPLNGLDVGTLSNPDFVDLDNDGDADLLVGESSGTVKYFENTENANSPTFLERTGMSNPLNEVDLNGSASPRSVDIDGDGDQDVFVGGADGSVSYFENTGTATMAVFVARSGMDNPLNDVDTPFGHAKLTLGDLDNDGDFDAAIGILGGQIQYFENTGTATNPAFAQRTGTDNPFGGFEISEIPTPRFVDIDNDGDLDVYVGSSDGNLVLLRNDSPLPVTLRNLQATPYRTTIHLTWITATELDHAGFHVEHATDARRWQPLGFVRGAGTTDTPQHYRFEHPDPAAGVNYYRLRQVDHDGTIEYSPTVTARWQPATRSGYTITPNPAISGTVLQLDFATELTAPATLEIFDATGRRVRRQTVRGTTARVSTQDLAPGWYHFSLNGQSGQRVIVR